MQVVEKKLSEITPYENNPRNNDVAVDKVADSIREFGFQQPIVVDADGVVIVGHTRLKAAKKLGMETVPCVVADTLTDEQVKAYRLADNKTNEFAEWNFELLDTELFDIRDIDMSKFGFDMDAFADKLTDVQEDDFVDDLPDEPTAKLGQIWKLGRHRLMCGDATSETDVESLMDRATADMVFTDPPYALFGNSTGVAGVVDDKMTRPFFLAIFQRIREHTKLFGHIYVCCDWHSAFSLQAMAKQAKLTEKNLCIWDKGDGGLGAMYQQCYEMIWFFANSPLATQTIGKRKSGERTINGKPNIWRYARENTKERVHNAQKPLEMVKFAVGNSCDREEVVLDLFGGSGSTLMACEQLDRQCYMMELDPHYCDVIIQRWEQYTGQKAELIHG